MWIRTQNKQRIINSDQIIDIFVARTAPVLYANTTDDADFLILGEYKDKDTCLDILECLLVGIGSNVPAISLPLGGEVEEWKKEVETITTAYISKEFIS